MRADHAAPHAHPGHVRHLRDARLVLGVSCVASLLLSGCNDPAQPHPEAQPAATSASSGVPFVRKAPEVVESGVLREVRVTIDPALEAEEARAVGTTQLEDGSVTCSIIRKMPGRLAISMVENRTFSAFTFSIDIADLETPHPSATVEISMQNEWTTGPLRYGTIVGTVRVNHDGRDPSKSLLVAYDLNGIAAGVPSCFHGAVREP